MKKQRIERPMPNREIVFAATALSLVITLLTVAACFISKAVKPAFDMSDWQLGAVVLFLGSWIIIYCDISLDDAPIRTTYEAALGIAVRNRHSRWLQRLNLKRQQLLNTQALLMSAWRRNNTATAEAVERQAQRRLRRSG